MGETPQRICMFSNLFYPVVSGSSTQSRSLAEQLVQMGHHVIFFTARLHADRPEYEKSNGVHVYRLPAYRLPKLPVALNFPWLSYTFTRSNLRRIETVLREHRPDVLHLHNHMFDLSFSAVKMSRRLHLPLVITFHTVIKHANPLYNMLLYPGDRIFLHHTVVKKAQTLICPDRNMQRYVHQAHRGVPTRMIPYGIRRLLAPAAGAVEAIRRKHRLHGRRVILSLGHIHEIRSRRDEIRALPAIRKAIPNIVLLIVGSEMTDTPRKLAGELGVEDAVIFTGPAPYADIPAYLAAADVEGHLFDQDSQEETSLGIATLEAMGAGKAVFVAANENAYGPGVLKSGENLLIVESRRPERLAEAVIGLLRDEDRCRRMGLSARKLVGDRFAWPKISQETLSVYDEARNRFGASV